MKGRDTFKCGMTQPFISVLVVLKLGSMKLCWGGALMVSNYSIYYQSWLSTKVPQLCCFGVNFRSLRASLAVMCRLFRRGKKDWGLRWVV